MLVRLILKVFHPISDSFSINLEVFIISKFFVSSIFIISTIYLGSCVQSPSIVKKNSYFFLGLYHKYGREPFLDYFRNMESLTEEQKFEKFKELRNLENKKHAFSWFRDQVLHPHETVHTFEEINNLFS